MARPGVIALNAQLVSIGTNTFVNVQGYQAA